MDWGWERVGAGGSGREWVGGESVWVGVLYKKTGARRADDRPFSEWNYIAFAREMSNLEEK